MKTKINTTMKLKLDQKMAIQQNHYFAYITRGHKENFFKNCIKTIWLKYLWLIIVNSCQNNIFLEKMGFGITILNISIFP
jgi:hypothetical protein